MNAHPTAIIDPHAKIAGDVKIGAYTLIGANVEVGGRHGGDVARGHRGPHARLVRTTAFSPTLVLVLRPRI